MKKILILAMIAVTASLAFAQGVKGDIGSDKVIKATKKMGAKNSPTAITTIVYSRWDNKNTLSFKDLFNKEAMDKYLKDSSEIDPYIEETLGTIAPMLREKLEKNSNFTLISEEDVRNAINAELQKQLKSKKAKNVWGVLSGKKSLGKGIWDGLTMDEKTEISETPTKIKVSSLSWKAVTPGNYIFFPSLQNDFLKPIQKSTKCKSFITAVVQVGAITEKDIIKFASKTTLYLVNEKGEVIKKIHGAAFTDPIDLETVKADPSLLTSHFPELTEKSIDLATTNFARELALFDFKGGIIKKDTIEMVNDMNIVCGVDADYFFDVRTN